MGSSRLIDALPQATSDDHRGALLGDLAAAIAGHQRCPEPAALPDRTSSGWTSQLDASLLVADTLGRALELLTASDPRQERGAHFTPMRLADRVARRAVDNLATKQSQSPPVVLDPAAGGGAFLLAAARTLRSHGFGEGDIVTNLHAADIDQQSLDVCRAGLHLWSRGAAEPHVHHGDAPVTLGTAPLADIIVGNPPFLSQLRTKTSRSGQRQGLPETFGLGNLGYLDEAGVFVVACAHWLRPDGSLALILPQSLLAAADAQHARILTGERLRLKEILIPDRDAFEASVEVAVLMATGRESGEAYTIDVRAGGCATTVPYPHKGEWSIALAATQGVPPVQLSSSNDDGRTLATLASVTAGFRQHFYGLDGAVQEEEQRDQDASNASLPRLVTVGAIDPLVCYWGERSVKFNGSKWLRPVVAMDEIVDSSVRDWFEQRRRPKLLLASQTRIVEVLPDPLGRYLPSVPVLTVEWGTNADEGLMWRLTAMLSSAETCAHLRNRSAGTGLSDTSIRIRASQLVNLPLPSGLEAWQEAANTAQSAFSESDPEARFGLMRTMVERMHVAWGTPKEIAHELTSWWTAEATRRRRSQPVT